MIFMKQIKQIINFISIITNINYIYIYPFFMSLFILFISRIFLLIVKYILSFFNNKTSFILYKKVSLIINIFYIISLFIVWDSYLNNFITLISFISATLTLALKDIIFNYFSGLYIKLKKPFNIDDRIEINNIKGDVVAINSLDFEIIEIGDYINSDQSTGKIINIPNSLVLLEPVKNYNKNFKYIWYEIVVKTSLDSDVQFVRKQLYEIINNNDLVKNVTNNKPSIKYFTLNERFYFNKTSPFIYIKVVDSHIEFYVRYLIYPKKNRIVEDYFWTKVLELYKDKKINLLNYD